MLEVVDFWEDYLKFEDGRYLIVGDAIHEGSGRNVNPILSLGLVRNAFDLALDMSKALDADADRREKWEHVLEHLSSWTTQEMGGKTVFRYTEEGTAWWGSNTLGIQHIYPGNALGLDSDPKWIKVSHNMIDVYQRWLDFNGTNSLFPAAVRVGYDPEIILEKLRGYARHSYPNGFKLNNPHGIENFSTVPNTINMMLCMSHVPVGDPDRTESLIRLFAVWPRDRDARFAKIRTWGAFLISSALAGGHVQYVKLHSEHGRDCAMLNPWPDTGVQVFRGGKPAETLSGVRVTFKTAEGENILLGPVGVPLEELRKRMRPPAPTPPIVPDAPTLIKAAPERNTPGAATAPTSTAPALGSTTSVWKPARSRSSLRTIRVSRSTPRSWRCPWAACGWCRPGSAASVIAGRRDRAG